VPSPELLEKQASGWVGVLVGRQRKTAFWHTSKHITPLWRRRVWPRSKDRKSRGRVARVARTWVMLHL